MFFEHLGTYIALFFRLAYTHQVKLDHNFVCVAMAIKVMEGLAIALDPELGAPHAMLIPTTRRSTFCTQIFSVSLDVRVSHVSHDSVGAMLLLPPLMLLLAAPRPDPRSFAVCRGVQSN